MHVQTLARTQREGNLSDPSDPKILVLWKQAGSGYPQGLGPYKVAARFFPHDKIDFCVRTITDVAPCKYLSVL